VLKSKHGFVKIDVHDTLTSKENSGMFPALCTCRVQLCSVKPNVRCTTSVL